MALISAVPQSSDRKQSPFLLFDLDRIIPPVAAKPSLYDASFKDPALGFSRFNHRTLAAGFPFSVLEKRETPASNNEKI